MNENPQRDPLVQWFDAQRQAATTEKQPLSEADREALFEMFGATWRAMSEKARPV